MAILELFLRYTGLQLNNSKIALLIGTVEETEVNFWLQQLATIVSLLIIKHPGLPLRSGKTGVSD